MINEIVNKMNCFHSVFIAFVSCFLKFFLDKVMYFTFFFTVKELVLLKANAFIKSSPIASHTEVVYFIATLR